MSKDELKETLFNTFPRRRQQNNNPVSALNEDSMECILCKRQISVKLSDHKCEFRVFKGIKFIN